MLPQPGNRYRLVDLAFSNSLLYITDLSKTSLTTVPANDVVTNISSNIASYGPEIFFSLASIHIYSNRTNSEFKAFSSLRILLVFICSSLRVEETKQR